MTFESQLEQCEYAFVKRVHAAQEAVHNQVLYLDEHWGQVESDFKEDNSRITPADQAISDSILNDLKAVLPDDAVFSEEMNPEEGAHPLKTEYAWILDPIDGTNNYALGMPQCAISLALLKNGVPVYGIVYDMSRDLMIQGGPGIGTYEGNERVHARTESLSDQSIIAMNFPLQQSWGNALQPLFTSYRVRCLGSAVLHFAYAISGKIDGAVGYRLRLWDLAACYALANGVGADMCFITQDPFPLKQFDIRGEPVNYYFGSASFCDYFKHISTQLA